MSCGKVTKPNCVHQKAAKKIDGHTRETMSSSRFEGGKTEDYVKYVVKNKRHISNLHWAQNQAI